MSRAMSLDAGQPQRKQQADGSSVMATSPASTSSGSALADINALLAKALPAHVRALPLPRGTTLRHSSALMRSRVSVWQAEYVTQRGSLDTAASAPSALPGPDTSEPTTQTKRSRFFSRDGRGPEAPHMARAASVPMRLSSSTNHTARPSEAHASSKMAVPECTRQQTATDASELSDAALRQKTSWRAGTRSQRSTEENVPQPVREPAPADRRSTGPVAARPLVPAVAATGMQDSQAATLRQSADYADGDGGRDNHDQNAPQRMTDATVESQLTSAASAMLPQDQDADTSQQDAQGEDALPREQLPVHSRLRAPARTARATACASRIQPMAGR